MLSLVGINMGLEGKGDSLPIATGIAVIPPHRDEWIICKDGIQSVKTCSAIIEEFGPYIYAFLAGRVPSHLRPETGVTIIDEEEVKWITHTDNVRQPRHCGEPS
jgi:hypothetical protein